MKKQVPIAGIAAIVSAVVLVGGYVLYRGGAGGSLFPSSKRGPVEIGDEARPAEATTRPEPIFPGSKSMPVDLMPSSKVGIVKEPVRMLPGSKSAAVFAEPATQPTPP